MKSLAKQLGIETFVIVKKEKIIGLANSPEFRFFFSNKILIDGLTDFHLTIKSELSDERKKELLRDVIKTWDAPKEQIFNL